MPISVSLLAQQLEIAPEAVRLHAMELDFEIPEDENLPDDIAQQISQLETGDTITQVEHEIEEQLEKEIIDQQQKATAGQQKKLLKKKKSSTASVEVSKDEDGAIIIGEHISVRELAAKIGKPLPFVIVQLKKNGLVANLKTELDYDTAAIISDELGVRIRKEESQLSGQELFHGDLGSLLADEEPENLSPRPPVISVMGHIDHGKTSLLDSIRKSKIADGEAGGITQKIGAYQIDRQGQLITFLDTPGHEAFTTMRARGARSTDIAILVVAANEGLKPQSLEAINHAREAEIPIIVALNKTDLPGADPERVKKELSAENLIAQDWGGETICLPVSAKTGAGIEDLLDAVLLTAEGQKLRANPRRKAIATVLESMVDRRSGVSATVLVNTGTLNIGDSFVLYDQYGRIRTMGDESGKAVKSALPSSAVKITGLSAPPQAGDLLQVMESEKQARKQAEEVLAIVHKDAEGQQKTASLAAIKAKLKEGKLQCLKLIVKADSKGALEAVVQELQKIRTEQSFVKVIHQGVGEVTESDFMLAKAGEAMMVDFGAGVSANAKKIAKNTPVPQLSEPVIYRLTEAVQAILLGREEDQETEKVTGRMELKAIFAANKKMAVIGGEVVDGQAKSGTMLRLWRVKEDAENPAEFSAENWDLVGTAKVNSLQRGSDQVAHLDLGLEGGVKVQHSGLEFLAGDMVEFVLVKKS